MTLQENNKNVLVTGAAGFIGSNMVNFLLKNTNFNIYGIDNLENGNENLPFLKKITSSKFIFIQDDFINFNFNKHKIEFVYHFAASPSVPYSIDNPLYTNENNVNKTLFLLNKCSEFGVKKFIFSSSAAIYGDTDKIPTDELVLDNCKSPYALQKMIIEKYCKMWSDLYNLDTINLRYFNVYGPNQHSNNAYSSVISSWIRGILEKNEIRLDGDGSQTRSFTYVEDICRANLFFSLLEKDFKGEIVNIADKNSYSLLEIKELLYNISNKNFKINYCPTRKGDIFYSHANTGKSNSYSFKTEWDLNSGLNDTYNWYKNFLFN